MINETNCFTVKIVPLVTKDFLTSSLFAKKYLHFFQFGSLHVLKDNELHVSWYRQCDKIPLRKIFLLNIKVALE